MGRLRWWIRARLAATRRSTHQSAMAGSRFASLPSKYPAVWRLGGLRANGGAYPPDLLGVGRSCVIAVARIHIVSGNALLVESVSILRIAATNADRTRRRFRAGWQSTYKLNETAAR